MSPAAQAKLLRVVTDGQVLRVGSNQPRKVDVRLLAATHRDLAQRVREGLFREDLYYRLAVVPIDIPPLRERREDIATLAELFVRQASLELKLPKRTLVPQALEKLKSYDFPGNVRELRNLIERASILSVGNELHADSFPGVLSSDLTPELGGLASAKSSSLSDILPEVNDLRSFLAEAEKALIARTLKSTQGAQAESARRLGISRSDLGYKVAKLGIRGADH
jgi:DNA-binding NtrC family response regulator